MVNANEWDCEGCEHWDYVNGCWKDSNPIICGELLK